MGASPLKAYKAEGGKCQQRKAEGHEDDREDLEERDLT